jgi:hypothetical protein
VQLEFDFRKSDTRNQRWVQVPLPGTKDTHWVRFEDTGYPDDLFEELRTSKRLRTFCGPTPPQ